MNDLESLDHDTTGEEPIATRRLPRALRYHCSPEWHLAQLKSTPFAGLVYNFALRVSKNNNSFHGSVIGLAEYFEVSRWKIQRAITALVKLGYFLPIAREAFKPCVYRPISHHEWAANHPGACAIKEEFPWSSDIGDKLGVRLWNVSGGRVRFQTFHIAALRKLDLSEDEIAAAFEKFIDAENRKRLEGGWHGRWSAVQPRFYRWLTGCARPDELKALGLKPYSTTEAAEL